MRFAEDHEALLRLLMGGIGDRQQERVGKDGCRLLETDPVLGGVRLRFLFVPFKIKRHGLALLRAAGPGLPASFRRPANARATGTSAACRLRRGKLRCLVSLMMPPSQHTAAHRASGFFGMAAANKESRRDSQTDPAYTR